MTRTKKNQPGDWVLITHDHGPVARGQAAYRHVYDVPAKILQVLENENGDCRVQVTYTTGASVARWSPPARYERWFDGPLPRITWSRQNGRNRWSKPS